MRLALLVLLTFLNTQSFAEVIGVGDGDGVVKETKDDAAPMVVETPVVAPTPKAVAAPTPTPKAESVKQIEAPAVQEVSLPMCGSGRAGYFTNTKDVKLMFEKVVGISSLHVADENHPFSGRRIRLKVSSSAQQDFSLTVSALEEPGVFSSGSATYVTLGKVPASVCKIDNDSLQININASSMGHGAQVATIHRMKGRNKMYVKGQGKIGYVLQNSFTTR